MEKMSVYINYTDNSRQGRMQDPGLGGGTKTATKTTLSFPHKPQKQEEQWGISQDSGKQMNILALCPRAFLRNTKIYKTKQLTNTMYTNINVAESEKLFDNKINEHYDLIALLIK